MNIRALPPSCGITVVRLMAGLIIPVAALEKFNAGGFDGFTKVVAGLAIPGASFWGGFIPLLELIGGLMVVLGLGARWVAVLFVIDYAITSFALKVPRQPPFGGWDSMRIDLMLLAAAIMLVLVGPGAFALESLLWRRPRRQVASMAVGG